jgi:uncharacterized protein (DUF934 family)
MSNKITFTYESNFEGLSVPNSKITYETDVVNIGDVVQEFRKFLLALGYDTDAVSRVKYVTRSS